MYEGGKSYLVVFQNKAEASGDRLKRAKGICRVSHPTKEQFDGGRYSRLPVQFVLIHGSTWFTASVFMKNWWCMIRNSRVAYIAFRVIRESSQHNQVHVLSSFPLCGIEVVDGEGSARSTFSPSISFPSFGPLPSATSTCECRCECVCSTSPLSTSAPLLPLSFALPLPHACTESGLFG